MIFFGNPPEKRLIRPENRRVGAVKPNIQGKETEDVHYLLLTRKAEERKLPIKALKERATGYRLSETRRLVQAVGRARRL